MRKRNNQGGGQRRHGGGGGQRRYNNNNQGGGSGGGGGGRNDHQNLARQKHHAMQMREKFMNHARDAQSNGDRVDVEYYLQHVDHYNRVLADIGVIEAERHEKFREQQQQQHPQGGDNQGGDNQGSDNHGGGNDASAGGGDEQPIQPGNQPRMTRQPRHQQQQQNADHNGAQAANANSEEIPLPGSAITAI